ncbi:hypothetical protein SDC9_80755 [bioreactor metagenome]|uniref:Uncharacterized protein n=1 Tax=bioreactor metagenome TaxID=1076179 RepID=A0A644Z615_9ZZZZ
MMGALMTKRLMIWRSPRITMTVRRTMSIHRSRRAAKASSLSMEGRLSPLLAEQGHGNAVHVGKGLVFSRHAPDEAVAGASDP